MVAHEDATATRGNILKSADLNLDTGCPHAGIRDPHPNSVKKTDISNQQRVGNADDSGNRAERQINKNQLESGEHTTFQHTSAASLPAESDVLRGRSLRRRNSSRKLLVDIPEPAIGQDRDNVSGPKLRRNSINNRIRVRK